MVLLLNFEGMGGESVNALFVPQATHRRELLGTWNWQAVHIVGRRTISSLSTFVGTGGESLNPLLSPKPPTALNCSVLEGAKWCTLWATCAI
jgi:hypothetical protein